MTATRNQIAAVFIIVLVAQVGLAFAISRDAADGARQKAEAKAIVVANAVEKKAFDLAVDTCRNTNPSRAFLQLRSRELTKGKLESTFTTRTTPIVFAIIDCVDTVRLGRPILLPDAVEERYLSLFKHHKIGITEGREIVGSIRFSDYFAEDTAPNAQPQPDSEQQPVPLPPGTEPGTP